MATPVEIRIIGKFSTGDAKGARAAGQSIGGLGLAVIGSFLMGVMRAMGVM
jgi:hypothetical protein